MIGLLEWSISPTENEQALKNKIEREILQRIFTGFSSRVRTLTVQETVQNIIKAKIKEDNTYKEATEGFLYFELGVPDMKVRMDKIIEVYTNNIKILPIGNKGFSVGYSELSIFDLLLSLPEASFFDARHDYSLPWLSWLIEKGTEVIIKEYRVLFKGAKTSRTGNAIMIRPKTGGSWSIPPSEAGTINDNFLSRGFLQSQKEIEAVLPKLFGSVE